MKRGFLRLINMIVDDPNLFRVCAAVWALFIMLLGISVILAIVGIVSGGYIELMR
jgi:hypothetical protein